jgi:phosphomannomutase
MATDGDGDRFGIVDEQGNILSPNTVLVLIARHLIKNKGKTGAIVRSVTTTHLLDRLAARYGLELYETPVGFKYIGEKMRETNVLIGGEQSGGLSIQGHIPEKDGILANLLVVEAIAYAGKPLSQLALEAIEEAGGAVCYEHLDFHFPEEDKKTAVMAALMQNPPREIAGIGVKHSDRKECVKLYLEDGSWIVVRPSGTAEPLMRVYLETNSPEKKTKIAAAMERVICQEAAVAV